MFFEASAGVSRTSYTIELTWAQLVLRNLVRFCFFYLNLISNINKNLPRLAKQGKVELLG